MSKQFEIGKQYRVADLTKGDGSLGQAIKEGYMAFPKDGIFTCHSRGAGNRGNADEVGYSHTEGVVNDSYGEGDPDVPCAYDEDLEAGVFEEVIL